MHPELTRAIQAIKTSKRELVMQILTVFVFPIVLIMLGFIPIEWRIGVLIGIVSLLLIILFTEKWTPAMLGVAKGSVRRYFLPYAVFTGAAVLLIIYFGRSISGVGNQPEWWLYNHFLYLFFVVSLFQEIAYRGYLIPALGKLFTHPASVFIANVAAFTFLHVIFPNLLTNLPIALLGGIGFTAMYMRYPSLPLIVISHAILNFLAVLYGFFVIPGVTY